MPKSQKKLNRRSKRIRSKKRIAKGGMKFLTDEDVTLALNLDTQLRNFFTNLKDKINPKIISKNKMVNIKQKMVIHIISLKKDFSKIVLTKEFGSGAFGSVWKGKLNNSTNNRYAVKLLDIDIDKPKKNKKKYNKKKNLIKKQIY